MGYSSSFFVFSLVQFVDKILPKSGFKLWISGIGSDRSTNWATTTATSLLLLNFNEAVFPQKGFWTDEGFQELINFTTQFSRFKVKLLTQNRRFWNCQSLGSKHFAQLDVIKQNVH